MVVSGLRCSSQDYSVIFSCFKGYIGAQLTDCFAGLPCPAGRLSTYVVVAVGDLGPGAQEYPRYSRRAFGGFGYVQQHPAVAVGDFNGDTIQAVLAASPPQALPAGIPWDLDLITEMIDSATGTIRLQLLSYGVTDREHRFFPTLDNALRRAATRRVKVQIILSNWAKVHYSLPWIQSLAAVPGIEIKFSNIPEHSRGLIPYSRVEHAKYMTVDGQACWLGTSNWSRDYFHASRNISLLLHGVDAARQLDEFFALGWNGPYTETVDPCGDYSPPRRK